MLLGADVCASTNMYKGFEPCILPPTVTLLLTYGTRSIMGTCFRNALLLMQAFCFLTTRSKLSATSPRHSPSELTLNEAALSIISPLLQLDRDAGRLRDCRVRLNFSSLGSCALAGTGLPIDRHMTAEELGFSGPLRNRWGRTFRTQSFESCCVSGPRCHCLFEPSIVGC